MIFFQVIRLAVVGFVILTVVYWIVSVYSRSVRREKLEEEWIEAGSQGERADFVDKGMGEYQGSLRRKLIVLIYVLPVIVVVGMVYIINFM